jgi:ABC-type antimicrobial peptide transport system permease subunit
VVTRANLAGLEQRDNAPFGYFASQPSLTPGFNLLVRSRRPTSDMLAEMRGKLREIDPTLPLYMTATLQEGIDSMLLPRRGITLLLGMFAGVALLLAAVGLYGVLAYDVSQRTREIGIRGAIGATRGQIISLILRQGLGRTVAGIVVGSAGALCLTRYLRTQLFDVASIDPLTYALVSTLLLLVALLACWLPALRAAKVDPVIALRAE